MVNTVDKIENETMVGHGGYNEYQGSFGPLCYDNLRWYPIAMEAHLYRVDSNRVGTRGEVLLVQATLNLDSVFGSDGGIQRQRGDSLELHLPGEELPPGDRHGQADGLAGPQRSEEHHQCWRRPLQVEQQSA